ncbi:glycosyltransferase family 4 protein [Selenomonas sp.]|uniref:glycosyltransferase family 4 protein n=1 Tax=Selenomonas sp. TaxID=2053611 RepID=UPI0025EFA21B|nr:glycosyltransferase family 4 protein [Selenomonas sp.]MCI6086640.1 glycosyltransferase family 4 protein [Selenomonas sp.]MDY3297427.1 glycosyltransferase family 4 protein [Selenomonas sp.]MDY4415044.1 glycosyltransferase family 4 protein [Selenomonas sp.]
MKVAIVHEWLVTYAGSERVLGELLALYPDADVFAVCDFVPEAERAFLRGKHPQTTFIQRLPGARRHYQSYLPLLPLAIEQLDVTGYDLVISSSHCVAKGVLTGPNQVHISYIHSPMRYAWDLTHQYLREAGLTHGAKGWLARLILHYMRLWDTRTASGVDAYIANSRFIARRVQKCYGREAAVIYPPVDVAKFALCAEKQDYYLAASRMTPYKKMKLIVEAFNTTPDRHLVVIGTGPEYEKTAAIAGPNIEMLGYQPDDVLRERMQHAKAFVFAAEEDFGITPVEAQACGTPVIAYGRGGALETVRGLDVDAPTGVFFPEQTATSIVEAVRTFEAHAAEITPAACRANAERFRPERFRAEIAAFVEAQQQRFSIT